MEHERDVVRRGRARQGGGAEGIAGDRERPGWCPLAYRQAQHRDLQLRRDTLGRRMSRRVDQQRRSTEIVQIKLELLGPVGRVQRRRRRTGGHSDEGRGHLGAARQNDGNPVAAPYPQRVEPFDRRGHALDERAECQKRAVRCTDRRIGDCTLPEKVEHAGYTSLNRWVPP